MNENVVLAKLTSAHDRVNAQITEALKRANAYFEKNVPYSWGGKTEKALDCSGLMCLCYPNLFPGAENQYEQLEDWLFKEDELIFFEEGDLIFFAEKSAPNKVSHVGIIQKRTERIAKIIHSSETQGGVVIDHFDVLENTFRNLYLAVAVAKIRPFLFRCFLQDEIRGSLPDAE